MAGTFDEAPFRTRVRYVECNAHGELPLATYVNYFSEASAQALRRIGLDLQALTERAAVLREGGVTVHVYQSPSYDEEVQVEVGLEALHEADFSLCLNLKRVYRGDLLAQGSMRFAARPSAAQGAAALSLELTDALGRLRT